MRKNIKRLCRNCGSPFYTSGKNEHHYCSLLCLADNVTEKHKSRFEATDCWIWHDEEAEMTNRETNEAFSIRNALLDELGMKTDGKFTEMRCERRCCVNPDHIMICDNPDEYYFDKLTKQLNPDIAQESFKTIGTEWKPKF